MNNIITVNGEIAPARLGFCQPHEHLFTADGPAAEGHPAVLIDDVGKTLVDVVAFKNAGGRSVVDAQPVFTGRDARAMRYISKETGVHAIASTGFHNLVYYGKDNPFLDFGEDAFAGLFTEEIQKGMYADCFYTGEPEPTNIRAGQIKAALEREFKDVHKRLFSGAASASRETGVPVMIHVDKDADPLMLLDFFAGAGVSADRQIYCHIDRAIEDLSIHKEIARAGAYIEYDTIARPKYHGNDVENKIILEMLDAGHEDVLLFSLDMTRERLKGYGGTPGLDYILREYIPELKALGVGDTTMHKIFIANPAAVYTPRDSAER